jgi:aconitate hydratase
MTTPHSLFNSLQRFDLGNGQQGQLYSLPALERAGVGEVSRLPVSIRLVLESVLRNVDGKKVCEANVRQLAGWKAHAPRTEEIPFIVARIVLQDFTGVPLLVDLAAMRSAVERLGRRRSPWSRTVSRSTASPCCRERGFRLCPAAVGY